MPYHSKTINSIVPETRIRQTLRFAVAHLPNGTAPEEPAVRRKKFRRKTMTNMILRVKVRIKRSNFMLQRTSYVGNAVAVKKASFRLSWPPTETYNRPAI